jgi:hypothetical protein
MFISKKGLRIIKKSGLKNMPIQGSINEEATIEVEEPVKATVVKKTTTRKNNDAAETVA